MGKMVCALDFNRTVYYVIYCCTYNNFV